MSDVSGTGQRIVLALWAGALWTSGYIVAPMLFATLDDPSLAGMLAGEMFSAVAWVGMACLLLLLSFQWLRFGVASLRRWTSLLLAVALVLTMAGEFGLRPLLEAAGDDPRRFGMLHGLSAALHLGLSMLALALVAWDEPAGRSR